MSLMLLTTIHFLLYPVVIGTINTIIFQISHLWPREFRELASGGVGFHPCAIKSGQTLEIMFLNFMLCESV